MTPRAIFPLTWILGPSEKRKFSYRKIRILQISAYILKEDTRNYLCIWFLENSKKVDPDVEGLKCSVSLLKLPQCQARLQLNRNSTNFCDPLKINCHESTCTFQLEEILIMMSIGSVVDSRNYSIGRAVVFSSVNLFQCREKVCDKWGDC